MAIKRSAPQASVAEVLDRVLDRGIVIDAWLRVSVAGITLLDVDARIVVASIDTYVRHAEAVADTAVFARPLVSLEAAPATAPPRVTRPARRPRRRLRCEAGCTFIRRARHCPATVRCPAEPGRSCPVTAVPTAV
jgi:gas vesicle structural protein